MFKPFRWFLLILLSGMGPTLGWNRAGAAERLNVRPAIHEPGVTKPQFQLVRHGWNRGLHHGYGYGGYRGGFYRPYYGYRGYGRGFYGRYGYGFPAYGYGYGYGYPTYGYGYPYSSFGYSYGYPGYGFYW